MHDDNPFTEAAFDTSCGVALAVARNGEVILRRNLSLTGRDSDAVLAGWLQGSLSEIGLTAGEIARWTVGTGPGSFSGLRVGISLVKGICQATGRPLRGVPSSLALARATGRDAAPGDAVAVLHDARRRQVILSIYKWNGTVWTETVAPEVNSPAAVAERVAGCLAVVTVHAGEVAALLPADLAARLVRADFVDAASLLDPPGWPWPESLDAQEASCQPIYVRPAVFVPPQSIRATT